MNDPLVEEVRRIRDEHSRSFDYDLDAIYNSYQEQQLLLGNRLVRLSPKQASTKGRVTVPGKPSDAVAPGTQANIPSPAGLKR